MKLKYGLGSAAMGLLMLGFVWGELEPAHAAVVPVDRREALEKVWYGANATTIECENPQRVPNEIARLSKREMRDAFKRDDCRMRFENGPYGVAALFYCGEGDLLMAWADSVEGCEFLVSILKNEAS